MTRKPAAIRKQEIIDAARDLIARRGVTALTIKNVSKSTSISEPALYRHFTNKRAILSAMIDDFEHHLTETIDGAVSSQAQPLDQLKEIMERHMLLSKRKKGIFFALTAESIHFNDAYLRRKVLAIIERYQSRIKKILKGAQAGGHVRPDIGLDAAGLAFFGLIQTCVILYSLTNYTVFPVNKSEALWNIFLSGIR